MALSKDLPIYKLAYDLLCLAAEVTRNMPRDFKASLGGRVRDECVTMLVLIGRANAAADKVPHINELLEHLHVVELLMRLAHDKRFISHKLWADSVALSDRLGKQASGWRRFSAANTPAA